MQSLTVRVTELKNEAESDPISVKLMCLGHKYYPTIPNASIDLLLPPNRPSGHRINSISVSELPDVSLSFEI